MSEAELGGASAPGVQAFQSGRLIDALCTNCGETWHKHNSGGDCPDWMETRGKWSPPDSADEQIALLEQADSFIESIRDLGRGALIALADNGPVPRAIDMEDALDTYDRQIDHILGWLTVRLSSATTPEASPASSLSCSYTEAERRVTIAEAREAMWKRNADASYEEAERCQNANTELRELREAAERRAEEAERALEKIAPFLPSIDTRATDPSEAAAYWDAVMRVHALVAVRGQGNEQKAEAGDAQSASCGGEADAA